MGDKQDLTSPLLGKDEDDITAAETAITGTDPPSRDLGDGQHFFSARSSHAASSRSVRTVSFMDRSAKWPARLADVDREDHMSQLIKMKRASMAQLFASARDVEDADVEDTIVSLDRKQMQMDSEFVQHLTRFYESLGDTIKMKMPAMEIRLEDVSYRVPSLDDGSGAQKIHTIYNSSPLYTIKKFFERLGGKSKKKVGQEKSGKKMVTKVLTNVNLVLKPKKMYLVLGPPLSGKTSLLKAIAGMLEQGEFPSGYPHAKHLLGKISYNGLVCSGDGADESLRTLFKNLVAFVRQNDAHAPRLTVAETFLFSGSCKDENIRKNQKGDAADGKVGLALEGLGLSHVKDTFVGNEQVRGVSGGQRRRVTLGEMTVFDTPLLCGDEISTGLDTASTVDILRILSYCSYTFGRISVVSLLQPSPEAVALFDEVILLGDGGNVIFAGPTEDAAAYFRRLDYAQPESMDNADYLLAVASSDRKHLYQGPDKVPHTSESLAASFSESKWSRRIAENQRKEWDRRWDRTAEEGGHSENIEGFRKEYQNSFGVSVMLNLKRAFVLWTRDRTFIRASVIKNVAMGLSVGFVFLNTNVYSSFFGVLFQGNLFIMLGAMTSAPGKLDDRTIFYKHDDSNFYPALSYLIGQSLALVPQMLIDVLLFGTFVYWMVGFVATAKGFLLYLALFFSFNFTMGQCFGLLASMAPNKSIVQAGGAVILLLNVLFCGYIVSPTVIPGYYIWIYWTMPLAWVYRALIVNEFTSKDYEEGNEGDLVLRSYGFLYNGEPFGREWIAFCFAYLFVFLLVCFRISAACLHYLRMEPKPRGTPDMPEEEEKEIEGGSKTAPAREAAFVEVDLSFKDLSYEVKASKGSDTLRLLDNISGIFSAGRMCALMGESGAGKTTLMDVIALRKASGSISGEVLLNGFPQEGISFRRCSGYVEQFDVQSAELTVRETIRFSAQLRLEKSNPVYDTPNGLEEHIESVMETLELTREADLLVGSEEDGGLTFEQKKRLSIAVEVAASPSVVFLDEPTSGLDARAALLVMNGLKKLCDSGRTVVATIHQPSSSVFDMFDDLLLLKKGGKVVYFGDLGDMSGSLVSYFEDLGASKMNKGENPATWMLNVLGETIMVDGEDGREEPLDFAKAWAESSNNADLQLRMAEATEAQDPKSEIKYETEFAAPWYKRDNLMARRLVTIYWRSPAYNLSRMVLSLVIAFLLGSIFIPLRSKLVFTEPEITSLLSTIFISFIIIGVLSITSVIPVALSIRDMYYRHKAAGMLNSRSLGRAFASAEKRFIIISSVLFCIVFVPTSGIVDSPDKDLRTKAKESIAFWGFFAFNGAIYSYIGQLFTCLVRGQGTATILASIFIGINNFFSGLIVRPQQMTGFWQITYWINPGHFVYEGLVMSVFSRDTRRVIVREGSDYFVPLRCDPGIQCEVEVSVYVDSFFGGLFQHSHVIRNAIILGCILSAVRMSTFLALGFCTYSGK